LNFEATPGNSVEPIDPADVSAREAAPRKTARLRSPLLLAAASFGLGVYLAGSWHANWLVLSALPACVCLLAGLLLLRAGWERFSLLVALAGFLFAGASAGGLFQYRFPPNHVSRLAALGVDLREPIRLEGRIISTPLRTAYGLQFDLKTQRAESHGRVCPLTGKVRLRLQASESADVWVLLDALRLQYGDRIGVAVRLRKPRIYQNPGSFDFRRWMESIEDICWVGTIRNPVLVEKLPDFAQSAEGALECGGLTPPFSHLDGLGGLWRSQGGVKPPHSKALRAFVLPSFAGLGILVERTRNALLQSIDDLYPRWSRQGRCGTVLKAVLLGDRSALDSETIEDFRKSGLYHLLVIAGLHVGLLVWLASGLLRRFPLGETSRRLIVLALLIFYSFLVEQRAPTLRATLMISLYLLAGLIYRDHAILNTIGLAALILLLSRPAWLFESGFQLSFSAALLIAGLALPILERTTEPYRQALRALNEAEVDAHLAPRIAQYRLDLRALIAALKKRSHFLHEHDVWANGLVIGPAWLLLWTANMLLFSLILQAGLLLPMATIFHRVALAGIGLNALAVPLMTLLLAIAVPTVLLGAVIPALAVWPAKLLALVMAGLFALTGLAHLPGWLSFRVPTPPLWVGGGFVLFVLCAAITLGRRAWAFALSSAAVAAMAALVAIYPFAPRLPSGALEITALDCGQGDSLFLVLPDKTTVLVDASGTRRRSTGEGALQGRLWDPGEDIVSPYLWSRGIKKVDIVVLSHPHEDHLGGLFAVVRNFRVGEFWHAGNAATPDYLSLLERLREKGVPERTLAEGEQFERGEATVQALWPARSRPPAALPSNDDSLVLRLTYRDASVLLTGDISAQAERRLLASGQELGSQVLKVAHRGSNSSSSAQFLARVNPRVALITGASNDSRNLPGRETLERLRERGVQVFRPDVDGATTVQMGDSFRVTTFQPR